MNILCCGGNEWPEIFRKGEGRIFFDELEPYLLTRLPASQAECCVAGAVCVLYFNEGKGGIDCGPGGSDSY